MNLDAFKGSLERPEPAYLVKADQQFLVRKVYELCKSQVAEECRPFDWAVFNLEEDSEARVVDAALVLPWLSPRRWVWVLDAHLGTARLANYLKNPSNKTTLVLVVNKKPSEWPQIPEIRDFESGEAAGWIIQKARSEGYQIEPSAARTLSELLDEDFQLIEANLEKLFLFRSEEKKIDLRSVTEMVLQVPEDNVFELIGAVAAGRGRRALLVLQDLFTAGTSAQLILSMLHWNFRRLLVARELLEKRVPFAQILKDLRIWSYKGREREIRGVPRNHLARVLLRLREVDRLSKTTTLDERELLKRLVIDTCQLESL